MFNLNKPDNAMDSMKKESDGQGKINPQIQEIISLCKKFSISIKNIAEDQNNIKVWIDSQNQREKLSRTT